MNNIKKNNFLKNKIFIRLNVTIEEFMWLDVGLTVNFSLYLNGLLQITSEEVWNKEVRITVITKILVSRVLHR